MGVLRFCPAFYLSNSGLFARPFVIFLDVPGISSICCGFLQIFAIALFEEEVSVS
jgi:hypothetical protein